MTFVGFWDVARFCNWLHNGQGNGDTESGTYINIGNQDTFARQADATWVIPTEDEWYKAAYYDGDAGVYYDYPTGSNSVPDGIDSSGDTVFDTVCHDGYNHGHPNDVDNAGVLSPYGTMGQGGNVYDWNETTIYWARGVRGGNWGRHSGYSHASRRYSSNVTAEAGFTGFRVASVPEPGTITLLLCTLMSVAMIRRR